MTEPAPTPTPPPAGAENGTQAPAEGTQPPADAGADKQGVESLPEWAQRELRDARADAGRYRTQLREAEATLGKAKTPEEHASAVAEWQGKATALELEIAKRDAASAAQLPASLASRLVGSTPEELAADAEAVKAELAALLGSTAPPPREGEPGGGLDPQQQSLGDLAGTPREIAAAMRKMQRIR